MTAQKYYKRGVICAERFDEDDWLRKYLTCKSPEEWEALASPLSLDRYRGNFVIVTLEGDLMIHDGDWIATGANGEHWPIADDIFHKTYAELPVIPLAVAEYIQKAKSGAWGIIDCYYHVADNVTACGLDGVRDWERWIVDHDDAFARAWLDGYQIEEEASKCILMEF